MEKINNSKGSSSIEAVIIIPLILIFIMVIIMILILSYEKTAQVISVHQMSMTGKHNELSVLASSAIAVDGNKYHIEGNYFKDRKLKYDYKSKDINVRDIQNIVQILFYLTEEYKDEIGDMIDDW